VLREWAEEMGGVVEGDGSVCLPGLRHHTVRQLAELELRRLLEQIRVEVREDYKLALVGVEEGR
jgi:hypothetical protein